MRASTISSSYRTWYRAIPAQGLWAGPDHGAEGLGEGAVAVPAKVEAAFEVAEAVLELEVVVLDPYVGS
jgi:hypothetical protein